MGQAVRFRRKGEAELLVRLTFFPSSRVPAAENSLGEVSPGRALPPVWYLASQVALVGEEPALAHRPLSQWVRLPVWLLLVLVLVLPEVDRGRLGASAGFSPQDSVQCDEIMEEG